MTCEQHREQWEKSLESGLLGVSPRAVQLSRYRWLTTDQSQQAAFPDYMILPLTPFAKGLDGSWLGWIRQGDATRCPMVLAPRDEEFASVIGESFADAIFWMLVDELKNCWLSASDEGNTVWRLRQWLPGLNALLEESQFSALKRISNGAPSLTQEGSTTFISSTELQTLMWTYPFLEYDGLTRIRQYAHL